MHTFIFEDGNVADIEGRFEQKYTRESSCVIQNVPTLNGLFSLHWNRTRIRTGNSTRRNGSCRNVDTGPRQK